MRVWTHAPRWQPVAQFRTWLTRVVVNLCLDRKRRAPWVELEAAGEIVDPTPGTGEKAEADERARMLAAAVDKLPPRQRSAIVLHLQRGHDERAGSGNSRHVEYRALKPCWYAASKTCAAR